MKEASSGMAKGKSGPPDPVEQDEQKVPDETAADNIMAFRRPGKGEAGAGDTNQASHAFAEGARLHRKGELRQAVAAYGQAIRLDPDFADALNNLGVALRSLGCLEAAVASYRRSLMARPDDADILSNLGNAYRELGRYNKAAAAHQQAVTAAPHSPVAIFNLGLVLRDLGHMDEAIGCFERALVIRSDYFDCRWERALTLLQGGDYRKGFQEYAWRGIVRSNMSRPRQQPAWEGDNLNGRAILLHQERGHADIIQFARYLPLVRDRGGRVIVECPRELVGLLRNVDGVESAVPTGADIPAFDVHAPLSSLPALFATDLDSVPHRVPYPTAPPAATSLFGPNGEGRLRVGVAWSGDPGRQDSPRTACPLAQFIDLMDIPGVTFFSLQTGRAAKSPEVALCDALIRDVGLADEDPTAVASVVAALDLVITVDSSLAHLAGALGRPVWVLLPFASEWRWLYDREDSPWYPTLCLFRQERHGDWEDIFVRIHHALEEAARNAASSRQTA